MSESGVEFDATAFSADMKALELAMREASREAMAEMIRQAVEDARSLKRWRDPDRYEQLYPSGHWSWEVTGMASSSITGYIVPDKKLPRLASRITTSYHDGRALTHPHYVDDRVTGDYVDREHVVQGVITMNIAYAPYLQDYEMKVAGEPVTVEVLRVNWSSVYAPRILTPVLERAMERATAAFT